MGGILSQGWQAVRAENRARGWKVWRVCEEHRVHFGLVWLSVSRKQWQRSMRVKLEGLGSHFTLRQWKLTKNVRARGAMVSPLLRKIILFFLPFATLDRKWVKERRPWWKLLKHFWKIGRKVWDWSHSPWDFLCLEHIPLLFLHHSSLRYPLQCPFPGEVLLNCPCRDLRDLLSSLTTHITTIIKWFHGWSFVSILSFIRLWAPWGQGRDSAPYCCIARAQGCSWPTVRFTCLWNE